MSRLDELIQELCPDGVEFFKVGEICDVLTGGEPTSDSIKGKTPVEDYIFPVYSNGLNDNAIWGYSKTYRVDKDAVTFSSIGTIGYPTLRKKYFTPIIRLKVIIPKDNNVLNVAFLKYILETVDFNQQKSSVPNINANMIKSIRIPVPPIDVQREIVRILDNFTELTARKKQYEFYRDKLLTFPANNVAKQPLGKIADISRGVRVVKKDLHEEGKYPVFQNCLAPMGYYNQFNRKANATFLISAGAAGEIGYSTVDFWAADDCFTFDCNEELNNRFLYHVLKSKQTYIFSQVRKASIPRLSRETVEKLEIPVPPLDVQERLVHVLDNFDAICSDLNIGLPAEIEARQKQYEFYRDKLLTFAATGEIIARKPEAGSRKPE